ncbi:MAG: type II toxin-antitoxin system HicA family toxin [Desulfarculus sp.]|nr:type II toxin-antitoxin system HicA family toxin [Desulfarculus sp.]
MLNSRQRKTLLAVFERPARADIRWNDIEALFLALGGLVQEGAGSRVRVMLGDARAIFHRPHPRPTANKGTVEDVRRLLENAGVRP